MPHQLNFKVSYQYDSLPVDINVPVKLRSGTLVWETTAKLDPGSTFCVFQREIGEHLGFDIERGSLERIGSVRGSFRAYGHELTLLVLGIEIVATVYFAADYHFPVNVLGRVGLLNRVRLGLVDDDCRLYLSENSDPA